MFWEQIRKIVLPLIILDNLLFTFPVRVKLVKVIVTYKNLENKKYKIMTEQIDYNYCKTIVDWFIDSVNNIDKLNQTDVCQLLLCAKDLDVKSYSIQRKLISIRNLNDPPFQQNNHIVQSFIRQVVLMRYEIAEKEKKDFFQYWISDRNLSGKPIVTVAYIIMLAVEQLDLIQENYREYVSNWFFKHNKIESLKVRAWIPRIFNILGNGEKARKIADKLLSERNKNGSWVGGPDTTAVVLYALIHSSVVQYADIKESVAYITNRLAQGTTENTAIESATLRSIYKLNLLPNSLYDFLKEQITLSGSEFKYPKLFLCYAKEDETEAHDIYLALKKERLSPWMDKPPFHYMNEGLKPGENFDSVIRKKIKESDYFIALLSKSSINKKGYVQREFKIALDIMNEIPLDKLYFLPVLIEKCEVPDILVGSVNLKSIQWYELYINGVELLIKFIWDDFKQKI